MKTATLAPQTSVRTNILVVDDRPEGLLALEAVFSDDNYNLIKASSGHQALQCSLLYDFAVILLDVQMPELDGFETAQLLRRNLRSQRTPIIFVTAINKEARHINQGYESGAVDYIFKPLDPFVLKSKVSVFVDLFRKNQQIKEQAALLRTMELEKKEQQLLQLHQENLRRYDNLADAVPQIILKLQPDGKVSYINQSWREYTGFDSKALINWRLIVHPKDINKFLSSWVMIRRQKKHDFQIELRLRAAKDGIYRWHLIKIIAELNNKMITDWIATCTDIDDLKKAGDKFRLLSQELTRSNKELEEFAYVASHDLKEPLHVVSSFACLLEKRLHSKLDEHEKDFFKYIMQATDQAQTLMKELLEYSRIGKERSVETVYLSDVLTQVLQHLKINIEESGATIKYDRLPDIKGNHLEMIQLFQNLIANALKFRNEDGKAVEITISVKPAEDMWLFSIKDNGIGIDPEFKDRIFEMFQRLHSKTKYSGTGVGLAVCKKIIQNQGGKIWVESNLNQGSTFYFTLKQGL
jgi:PAS domain S-box-containing protein